MRVISWNVNGIRARMPRILALLARHEPEVLCLQETKVQDADFPADLLTRAGYGVLAHGQPAYNGVAILTRMGTAPLHPEPGFPGNPLPDEARVLAATVGDLRILDLYVPNGREVGHEYYDLKLRWLDRLSDWLAETTDPTRPLILVGDFNIAPSDRDVHDPAKWAGSNLVSEAERARFQRLIGWGLVDLQRAAEPKDGRSIAHDRSADHDPTAPGPFTWWDYRFGAFSRGWGLRIDLALATAPVAARCRRVWVDREERKAGTGEGKPSDHAPLVIDLD
jgi:exodeoxyribonuclease-3